MTDKSFELMHPKSPKRVIHWPQKVTEPLSLEQNRHTDGLERSGPERVGPNSGDEDMRERYRI
jgi:hypothetical protein